MKKKHTISTFVILLFMGGFFVAKGLQGDTESPTMESVEKVSDKERIQVLEKELETWKEQRTKNDQDQARLEKAKLEESILKTHDQFVEAMFTFESPSKKNETLISFIYNEQRVKALYLDKEPEGYPELTSKLVDHRNYFRQLDEVNYEVLSTVEIFYNHDQDQSQYLFLWAQYRKTEDDQWKVYYTRTYDNPIPDLYEEGNR
ncbi:hypothetical protein IGI96_002988 [Enterococcus sp. DIV0421]|uniref:hypothetical protein n=1 Tax=Enterococcus sp. DIV0421 TaxID=2774688 RepID=UPI003F22F93C